MTVIKTDFSITARPDLKDDTADIHYVPAPCQVACPIGTDAPSYIAYIWEGKNEEALEAIRSAKFKAGRQRGKPVKVKFSLPVRFRLK